MKAAMSMVEGERSAKRRMTAAIASLAVAFLCGTTALLAPVQVSAQNGPYELPDDHFLCYKGKASKTSVGVPDDLQANLLDQFGPEADYDVTKERGICTPADKNGEGIVDPVIHLTPYQIKTASGEPKHVKQINVHVVNQFGDLFVDTVKEARLLVPAAKNPAGTAVPPPPNIGHNVDHYKCYKVKVNSTAPDFVPLTVSVEDQFESPAKVYDLLKPKLLCNPVDKNGEGIKHPDGHLFCYQAKPATGQPAHEKQTGIYTADQFIGHQLDTKKEEMLCVPSLKNPPPEYCGDAVVNQLEDCDGDAAVCAVNEVCRDDCLCSLCGNGTLDLGEDCELDTDCGPTDECNASCACVPKPPLGQRTISLGSGSGSGFFTSLLPGNPVAVPSGTIVLDAGALDGSGIAAVSLAAGPYIVTANITLAGTTLCTRVDSCTGSLYCFGGVNVDVLAERDSLALAAGACVQDGSNDCPNNPANVCCSNACEGVGVGSGNSTVKTSGVNPGDSGAGAMLLTCTQRIVQAALNTNCSTVDYSSETPVTELYTTGSSTGVIDNHCAGTAAAPDVAPTFAKTGENFNCSLWNEENTAGALSFTIPTEEPSGLLTGDGSNAGVLSDD